MRKLLLIVVIIIPLMVFGILILKNESTTPKKSSAFSFTSPKPSGESGPSSIKIDNFKISWFQINNIDKLKLIPNFSDKISSQEVLSKYNCKFLSNGPFYKTENGNNQPTGLFTNDGNTITNWKENNLFDGILSINEMATPRITREIPQDNLNIAIQSGPILKENNSWQNLKIQNDSASRRVVAAVTGENKLYFLVVYNPNSEFSGPLLADLPSVLKDFEQKSGVTFADIINLDGGSASLFYTNKGIQLSELTTVGAFFCQL